VAWAGDGAAVVSRMADWRSMLRFDNAEDVVASDATCQPVRVAD
jgi:hypothetical protein